MFETISADDVQKGIGTGVRRIAQLLLEMRFISLFGA
jgi:hypothetical protein